MRTWTPGFCFVGMCCTLVFTFGGCGGIVDEQAKDTFVKSLGHTSITVFPAFVRDGEQTRYAAAAATTIGDFLTQNGLATVTVAAAEVPITSQWGMNQAKMFRGSAANFSAYVQQNPLETDYALLAEYLIGGAGSVVGVHFYVVDRAGTVAYGMLLNSHHEAFNGVNPRTVDDCTTMVVNVLRDELVPLVAAKQMGPDSSLTIVPVSLAGHASKDVADVVGLMLEQEGMGNIVTVPTSFRPPTGATLDETASAFGEFVLTNRIETDYALFGEFVGSPESGVAEVCGVLVDQAGSVVWIDRQTPEDADFQRIKPQNPMTCCVLLKERVGPQFRLTAATRNAAGEGRMAKLWAEKSGTPTKGERAAMEERRQTLKTALPNSKLLVFPVFINQDLSSEQAKHLVELFTKEIKCDAVVAQTPLRPEIKPSPNEQRRLWDLARSFQANLRENPPNADYALFAEYTIRPRDQKVWSVHFVICDRAGEWVIVDFQNDHQPDFQSIDPQTHTDCGRLVARRLASYLR